MINKHGGFVVVNKDRWGRGRGLGNGEGAGDYASFLFFKEGAEQNTESKFGEIKCQAGLGETAVTQTPPSKTEE